MTNADLIKFLLIVVVFIVLIVFIRKKLKVLVLPNVVIVTGAPKTGKSALSLYLARMRYIKNVVSWFLGKPIYWLIHHNLKDYPIKPMFYSNIPVKFKHNKLTKRILLREVKIPKKSVVFIDEASLLADSMLIKDVDLNFELLLFFKLFGHTSFGGSIFLNSHTISDLHYSIKRTVGRYLYIYQTNKYPLFSLCKVREMVYSDDTSVVNNVGEDAELSMRTVFFWNFTYKLYDCFCYSVFTDNKMYEVDYDYEFNKKDLKAYEIISFNKKFDDLNNELKRSLKHEDFER